MGTFPWSLFYQRSGSVQRVCAQTASCEKFCGVMGYENELGGLQKRDLPGFTGDFNSQKASVY